MGFKPGQSGNPAGRPKGVPLFATVIRQQLAARDAEGRSAAQRVVAKLVEMAVAGNVQAASLLVERVDGKLPQPIDQKHEGGIEVVVRRADRDPR